MKIFEKAEKGESDEKGESLGRGSPALRKKAGAGGEKLKQDNGKG